MKYINEKNLISKEIFLKKDESGNWECLTKGEFEKEDDQEGFEKETVEFVRPSWALAAHVDRLSSDVNVVGVRTTLIDAAIESTVKFYWKKSSFLELELEKNELGFENISEDQWEKLVGEDGLSPKVVIGIYRSYREISDI